jgi:hypothetical protein
LRPVRSINARQISNRTASSSPRTHSRINENLGLPEDAPTKALFEFVAEVLKK